MPTYNALDLLNAFEADNGIELTPPQVAPVQQGEPTTTSITPDMSDDLKSSAFLMLLRDCLGTKNFNELIQASATDMEVYGILSDGEKCRLTANAYSEHNISSMMERAATMMAIDMALAVHDPLGDEYLRIEKQEHDVIDQIRAKYCAGAGDNIQEMLEEYGRKVMSMDGPNAEVLRNAIEKMKMAISSAESATEAFGMRSKDAKASVANLSGKALTDAFLKAFSDAGTAVASTREYCQGIIDEDKEDGIESANSAKIVSVNGGYAVVNEEAGEEVVTLQLKEGKLGKIFNAKRMRSYLAKGYDANVKAENRANKAAAKAAKKNPSSNEPATEAFLDHFRKTKKYIDPESPKYASIEALCETINADVPHKSYHGIIKKVGVFITASDKPSSNQIKAMKTAFGSIEAVSYALVNNLSNDPAYGKKFTKNDLELLSIRFTLMTEDRVSIEMNFVGDEFGMHILGVEECFDIHTGKFSGKVEYYSYDG